MLYLLFGTLVGIILGLNIAFLYYRFFGSRGKVGAETAGRNPRAGKRLRQKDEYIARAIRS